MMDKSHLQNYNISFHLAGTPYQQSGTFSQVSGSSHQQQSQCQQVPGPTQQVMQQPMQYLPAHQINQQLQFQLAAQGRLPIPATQQQQQPQQQQPQPAPQPQQIVAPQQQPSYDHMFHAQGVNKTSHQVNSAQGVNKTHQVTIAPQGNHQQPPSKEKDLDSIQNAHLEEVRKLQERIKQLEREKEEKEKLYDRIQRRIRTDQKDLLVAQQEAVVPESDDDGVEVSQNFCPSPERSYSSCSGIKEEPIDNPPTTTQGTTFTKQETTITANREHIRMTTNKEQMEMTTNRELMGMMANRAPIGMSSYKDQMELTANREPIGMTPYKDQMETSANRDLIGLTPHWHPNQEQTRLPANGELLRMTGTSQEQLDLSNNREVVIANQEIIELQNSNELMERKIAASQITGIQQKTMDPIDFALCIICQKFSDEDVQKLTEEGVRNIRKIVLNRDDEIGQRLLNEGLLDLQMFLNNAPKCHSTCNQTFKMENDGGPKQTDFSQCIICQQSTDEKLFNVTERGFPAIQFAVSNKKDLIAKRLAIYVFSQDMFLSFLPKIHRTCRKYVNRKKVLKALNRVEDPPVRNEIKEDTEPIVDPETGRKLSGEEMLELIREHKKKVKTVTKVAQPDTANSDSKCFICRKTRSKTGKEKYVYLDNIRCEKIKNKAELVADNRILSILQTLKESGRKLQHHKICLKIYLNKPIPKLNLYNLPYDIAFTCLIKQIEEPLFKQGKAFDVTELRNEYRHYLAEQGITSNIKAFKMSDKLRRYYTVPPKRCLVRIRTEVAQRSIVYSKHLSEEEVAVQIEQLKDFKNSNEEVFESENEAEQTYEDSKANQEALQEIIGQNVISAGSNSTIKIDQIFTKYKKSVKPKSSDEVYACSECEYKGATERALRLHMNKHKRELEKPKKQAMCEECGKIFHSKEACNRHKLTHGDRNFLCSHCGRDFHDKYTMRKHVLTHTGEKKYECSLCDMKFITQFYLKKHLLVHTDERPLMCTICGYSCKQKDRLKDHMSKHSDARPYVCNVCGKSFKFRQPLRTHMLLHGEKPQKCPECDFRCYTKGNLKSHMRKHTGEKVYKPPAKKVVEQVKPINTNPEPVTESYTLENNTSNSYYSYPVSSQDPRLYFPPTRHFQHIPPHYLFSNVQTPDPHI